MSCNAICRKNKTEKGYLCDKVNNPSSFTLTRKKWCPINDIDVKNYEKYLGKPYKQGNYYWDYISEENKVQKMCISNRNVTYNPCSSIIENIKYYLGVTIILSLSTIANATTGLIAISGDHLFKTFNFSNKNDKEIIIELINEFKKIAKKNLIDTGITTQEQLNDAITEIQNRIESIEPDNNIELGKIARDLIQTASNVIETNTKNIPIRTTSVMKFMTSYIPNDKFIEVLKGAYFVIEDEGEIYEYVTNNIEGYGRFSSHDSDKIQYGFTNMFGDAYLHLLCGSDIKNGKRVSWCQFEGAPMPPGLSTEEVFKNIFDGNNINIKWTKFYLDHFVDTGYYIATSKIWMMLYNDLPKYLAKEKIISQSMAQRIKPFKGKNIALGQSYYVEHYNPLYMGEKLEPNYEGTSFFYDKRIMPVPDENSITIIPLNIQELNEMPEPTNIVFEYLMNNTTYYLGIHDDLSAKYNLTGETRTITPLDRDRQKTLNYTDNLNIGEGIRPLPNMSMPITSLSYAQTPLAIGRGGKYKKRNKKTRTRNKKRTNKKITRKHKK